MDEKINAILEEIAQYTAADDDALEDYRMRFISRKSVVGELFGEMKNVAPEDRKATGAKLNTVKNAAQDKFQALIAALEQQKSGQAAHDVPDLTLPPARCYHWCYSSAYASTQPYCKYF